MTTESKKALVECPTRDLHGVKTLTSKRERQIVQLVVQGYGNSDIAQRLSINELAVREDLHSIYEKLALSDRLELTLYAIHHQLLDQYPRPYPGERLTGSSLGCRIRNAWVCLRRKVRKS